MKLLSMRLAASGLTVSKTALTSWTVKAIDRASGEEIYLNTTMPKAQCWATEDQALAEIGRLVGEEFSKNFFLQHFNFGGAEDQAQSRGPARGAQRAGAPVAARAARASARCSTRSRSAIRAVLSCSCRKAAPPDIVQDAVLKPLNAKLGQSCFALAGATGAEVNVTFSPACAEEAFAGAARNGAAGRAAGRRPTPAARLLKATGCTTILERVPMRARARSAPDTGEIDRLVADSAMLWPNVMRPWLRSITSSRRRAISASPANVTKVPLVL